VSSLVICNKLCCSKANYQITKWRRK